MIRVPFNRLRPLGREAEYLAEAMQANQLSGTGPFARRCEEHLQEILGGGEVLLTGSATAALEMATLLADLGPGDEVILPAFTFVSTANAVLLRGATPVFAEIDPRTLGLDPWAVRAKITPRTRAILPVHYGAVGCDMPALLALCNAHDLICIEDAAHCIGALDGGRPLGRSGALAVLSFHESKNLGCGEGGALIVNAPALLDRARILRDRGTNRQQFLQGQVDRYTWVDLGSSSTLSELPAAFLLGQLECLDQVTQRRREISARYARALAPLRAAGQITFPDPIPGKEDNGHIFYLFLDTPAAREAFIAHMAEAGVQAFFHYVPLHLSPMGARLGYRPGDLPLTEDVAARLVRLPLYATLTDPEVDQVISAARSFFGTQTKWLGGGLQ